MAADRVKTSTPGIFKRGGRYSFCYRVDGKLKWESARTLDEARRKKSERATDIGRGEFEERSRATLREFAEEWIERYLGRGRGGFREGTRDEYRRQLEQYVFCYFPERTKLTEVTPSRIAGFVSWLCDEKGQGKRVDDERRKAQAARAGVALSSVPREKDAKLALSDSTIRNILAPLRACLGSAVREGLIRSNPARDVDLPHRPTAEASEEEQARAMSADELSSLLALIPDRQRLMFRLLAATGLRISEAIALQWRHVELNGSTPHVKVRRALVKGRMGPPKSRHGRRQVPLEHELVLALRRHRKDSDWPGDEHLVFPAGNGEALNPSNLYRDALKAPREEANLAWVGFHSFRHTCASLLFAEGRNAVQVQRWLGHHSPAFTLARYVHLLDGDLGEPLALASPRGVTTSVTTRASEVGASHAAETENSL
jgi:integrase